MSLENEARAKKATLAGAVLAAIAASSCCIGPLILAALGIGGAGAFATLGAYRPYILAVTAVLLAGGFYLTYRKPKVVEEGDACGCDSPKPKANRAARLGLWIATALVVVFAAAPPLLAAVSHRAPVPVAAGQKVEQATIPVQGLDCEACAAPIRTALTKVGGFHDLKLDLKAQTVTVAYEPAPGRLPAYVASINDLGYEASLPEGAAKAAAR
jgi:mercuric ion transport protein